MTRDWQRNQGGPVFLRCVVNYIAKLFDLMLGYSIVTSRADVHANRIAGMSGAGAICQLDRVVARGQYPVGKNAEGTQQWQTGARLAERNEIDVWQYRLRALNKVRF